jgi:hypothetical protein
MPTTVKAHDRPALSIGSTVWVFDSNRRVYAKPPGPGHTSGGPIWREHWVERKVVGETRVSWITGRGERLPKRRGCEAFSRGYLVSVEEIDLACYANEHAHRIATVMRNLTERNPRVLAQIATLLGYEPKPPTTTERTS